MKGVNKIAAVAVTKKSAAHLPNSRQLLWIKKSPNPQQIKAKNAKKMPMKKKLYFGSDGRRRGSFNQN